MGKPNIGVRLTESEMQTLTALAKKNGQNKSETIRQLISSVGQGVRTNSPEELILDLAREIKYTSALLTSLVRRIAKANPGEAEQIINEAMVEAAKITRRE